MQHDHDTFKAKILRCKQQDAPRWWTKFTTWYLRVIFLPTHCVMLILNSWFDRSLVPWPVHFLISMVSHAWLKLWVTVCMLIDIFMYSSVMRMDVTTSTLHPRVWWITSYITMFPGVYAYKYTTASSKLLPILDYRHISHHTSYCHTSDLFSLMKRQANPLLAYLISATYPYAWHYHQHICAHIVQVTPWLWLKQNLCIMLSY